jgi:hypothetical protein
MWWMTVHALLAIMFARQDSRCQNLEERQHVRRASGKDQYPFFYVRLLNRSSESGHETNNLDKETQDCA